MIPALTDLAASAPLYASFLAKLRVRGVAGELTGGIADRTVLVTDNSIYQLRPEAVAFPRDRDDLVRIGTLLADPRFSEMRIAPRGGGTGTNGQSLSGGLMVVTSRHMNRILEIYVAAKTVRVEAGVVKDQLNRALAPHSLFFAPELSTSNRATIGGMVSTDACGQGSCLYGKTRDHVRALTCVLTNGQVWTSRPLGAEELAVVSAWPAPECARSLVLVQDAFTTHYETPLVLALLGLLTDLGFRRWLAPFLANGKPLHVHGFLRAFARQAGRKARMLKELSASGIGLVGLDPSMTLTCRAGYVAALGAGAAAPVRIVQEWLAARLADRPTAGPARDYLLLPHCTERTNAAAALRDWHVVFARLGHRLTILPSGCCGMAGTYGHEAEHRATSEWIYGLSWAAHVGCAGHLLADGYSCRSQTRLIDGVGLPHPIQALLGCLHPPGRSTRIAA